MITKFKTWFKEVEDTAIKRKKREARNKGDESKWKKEIWQSIQKNKDIKHKFRDEGFNLGYNSRPSYKSKAGEWLYDFIWRKFDGEDNFLELVLAMEIELSENTFKGFRYDFNKLLQSDATYKIFVFQKKMENEIEEIFKLLVESTIKYKSKIESEYLICGWCYSKNTFLFHDFKSKIIR